MQESRFLGNRLEMADMSYGRDEHLFSRSYSTVTDLARLRGWSTSHPRRTAMWYASNCKGITSSKRREHLHRGRHDDDVVGGFARQMIVFRDDRR